MVGDIEWENVNIAGAFVIGAVLGTLATIRVMRVIYGAYRDERQKDHDANVRRHK